MIQIVIQETVVAQSGTLHPGHQVTELSLLPGANKLLIPGIYEGEFLVFYYSMETGEKAIVNTQIPIRIAVTESL